MKRVLVCGGRHYGHRWRVWRVLDHLRDRYGIALVIHGGASGADSLAEVWAGERGVPTEVHAADWKRHGRAAGPIRNGEMLEAGKPDFVVAFMGGRGTADMIQRAEAAGVPVLKV